MHLCAMTFYLPVDIISVTPLTYNPISNIITANGEAFICKKAM